MVFKALVFSFLVALASSRSLEAQSKPTPLPPRIPLPAAYGKLPVNFEINRGQTAPQVDFLSRGAGYTAFLTSEGIFLSLRSEQVSSPDSARIAKTPGLSKVLQFRLVKANKSPVAVGEELQPGRVNYFIGNKPSQWRTDIATYGRVRYKDVYPGIDLIYYGSNRQLEYDLEVQPGADPRLIEFEIQGASHIELDPQHNLLLRVGNDRLTFQNPTVYQQIHSDRVVVAGEYVMKDATHVAFRVAKYDRSRPLVIDPVLIYSSYLGGSGNEDATGIAVDSGGNVYVSGSTDSSDFPSATLGYLPGGASHAFVAKLDPTGSTLIYADYLGGNSKDFGDALALDSANNVYITGSTQSSNFPVVNAYQRTYPGGFNGFLTKISPSGSSILYSTYLGGNDADVPVGVALDGAGNITVAGYTSSTNFPVSNAYQATVSANQGGLYGNYGFVTTFSADGSSLLYSTYLGGSSNVPSNCGGTPCWVSPTSTPTGVTVDTAGNSYVAGITNTYDFPVTSGTYQTTNSTQSNAFVGFVSKFSRAGTLQYSTYFYDAGGPFTAITALAVDSSGSTYITGQAFSDGTFPLTTTSICDPGTYGLSCSYAFVTKIDPTGSKLLYSTFLGPNNWAVPRSIALDSTSDAYVLAVTSSSTFNDVNGLETYSGGNDILLAELDPSGSSQLWATYLGGSMDESGGALAVDSLGDVYVAGTTDSTDFPTTQSAFQSGLGGKNDAFVLKVAPGSAPYAAFSPAGLQFSAEAVGSSSSPQTVLLRNLGSAPLSIFSVAINGDFSQTNNCGSQVAAAGSCSFSVTFLPTAAGTRNGTILLEDNSSGAPHVVPLTGDGMGASVSFSPSGLVFPPTAIGTTSVAQSVTIANAGNMPLHISNMQINGSYTQTNNCPSALAAGLSCGVSVVFAPSTVGASSGSLVVTDDAAGSPQTLPLTGVGSDFSVTGSPGTVTVKRGSVATYQLTVSPVGGAFSNTVKLACSLSTNANCGIAPASVTPGQAPGTATLTITTVSAAARFISAGEVNSVPPFAFWVSLSGITLFGTLVTVGGARSRSVRPLQLLCLSLCLLCLGGCAGGTGIVQHGTPPGTYTVTVTGTSGSLQHSASLTLVVQ